MNTDMLFVFRPPVGVNRDNESQLHTLLAVNIFRFLDFV